jgi:hypothetical protein
MKLNAATLNLITKKLIAHIVLELRLNDGGIDLHNALIKDGVTGHTQYL